MAKMYTSVFFFFFSRFHVSCLQMLQIRGPELLADGLELNPMQPVSVPTAATDTAVEPDRAEPPSVPKKNPTILSSKHTNHVRTGSVTSSVGTSAASTKQASIPGPNGALNMIGLGELASLPLIAKISPLG